MRPLSFLFLLLTLSCHSPSTENASGPHAYTFTGKIAGLGEGRAFLLHWQKDNRVDTAEIHEGSFVFTGTADAPEYCNLGFLNNGYMDFRIGFFLQSGKISLTGRIDSLQDDAVTINGDPAEDEFRNVSRRIATIRAPAHQLDSIFRFADSTKNKVLRDSIEHAVRDINQQHKIFIKEYALRHPSSYVAALKISEVIGADADAREIDSIYSGFDSSVRVSYYGLQIREVLEKVRITTIGQQAPDFTQNTPDGTPITLSSFKGKYVLLDFWASWCGPCRRENPAVVQAWRRFHPKGFDILGVSLDNNRDKWLDAIKKDQLPWNHVTDLNGWQNSVARQYGVRGIPMNYLLDRKGKIIAKNLRGKILEQKLASLFK